MCWFSWILKGVKVVGTQSSAPAGSCFLAASAKTNTEKPAQLGKTGISKWKSSEIIRNPQKAAIWETNKQFGAPKSSKLNSSKPCIVPFYLFFHRHSPFMDGDIPIFPNILARIVPPIINQSSVMLPSTLKPHPQNHGEILQSWNPQRLIINQQGFGRLVWKTCPLDQLLHLLRVLSCEVGRRCGTSCEAQVVVLMTWKAIQRRSAKNLDVNQRKSWFYQQNRDSTVKNRDFTVKNCDFTMKNVYFWPIETESVVPLLLTFHLLHHLQHLPQKAPQALRLCREARETAAGNAVDTAGRQQ